MQEKGGSLLCTPEKIDVSVRCDYTAGQIVQQQGGVANMDAANVDRLRAVCFPDGVHTKREHVYRNFGNWMQQRNLNPEIPIHRQRFRRYLMEMCVPSEWKEDPKARGLLDAIETWFPGIELLPLAAPGNSTGEKSRLRYLTRVFPFRLRKKFQQR